VCGTDHEDCLARRLVLWVLLEKITGLQLLKKYTAFYEIRRFITAFTCACHLPLSWASSIQSKPQHPTSWVSILILSSHLRRPSIIREIQSTEWPHLGSWNTFAIPVNEWEILQKLMFVDRHGGKFIVLISVSLLKPQLQGPFMWDVL